MLFSGAVEAALEQLTRKPEKLRLLKDDSFYRDAATEFLFRFSGNLKSLFSYGALLIKPEAIVGRKIERILDSLHSINFRLVYFLPVEMDGRCVHDLWRYQINIATADRIRFQTSYRPLKLGIFCLVHSTYDGESPASVVLKFWKGSSVIERQATQDLRYALGNQNPLISFIHTPDEPADFIREVGVLFEPSQRASLFDRWRHDSGKSETVGLREFARSLYRRYKFVRFDHKESRGRIITRIKAVMESSGGKKTLGSEALRMVAAQEHGKTFDLLAFEALLESLEIPLPDWDIFTMCAHAITLDLDGKRQLIDDTGLERRAASEHP